MRLDGLDGSHLWGFLAGLGTLSLLIGMPVRTISLGLEFTFRRRLRRFSRTLRRQTSTLSK